MKLPRGVQRYGDRFRAQVTHAGERVSLGVYDSPEDAKYAVDAFRARLRGAPAKVVTLRIYGERWLDRRETNGFHRNVDKDRARWRRYIATADFAGKAIRDITRRDVVSWAHMLLHTAATKPAKGQERAPKGESIRRQTVTNALSLLRTALRDACDDGLISANPAADVKTPRRAEAPSEWTYLDAEEIATVTNSARIPEGKRAIFTVAIYTGLRKGELFGLRWADVDMKARRLTVRRSHGHATTKSGKTREVPLLPPALAALETLRRKRPALPGAYVFAARDGGRFSEHYDAEWKKRWSRELERRHKFHAFRHTCASHLVMGTWGLALSMAEVAAWLGHSSTTTTGRYAHLSPAALQAKAREMEATWRK